MGRFIRPCRSLYELSATRRLPFNYLCIQTDFISRLRGTLDIVGIDHKGSHPAGVLLRRAGILAFQLGEKAPALKDPAGVIRIDDAVLSALLNIPSYHHGARSMEAILDMSSLGNCTCYSPSRLPQPSQLTLHVFEKQFNKLVRYHNPFGEALETIAQAIHADFLQGREREGNLDPKLGSHRPWEGLSEEFKDSNRDQARRIPSRLLRAGFYVRKKREDEPYQDFSFDAELLERLAKEEHERWMSEKLRQGWVYRPQRDDRLKHHDCLLVWDDPQLSIEQKEKDRQAIRMIPEYLKAATWMVVKE